MEPPPILAVERVSATPAGASTAVLRDVSFSVRAGDRVVLTGPSGSGKSTLLRSRVLLEAAEGEVRLDGEPVGPSRVRELRRRVADLPQQPVAVADTVGGNLAFPREVGEGPLDESAQQRLLARLGLADLGPDWRFDSLSGGEQQRVALVRSLTPRPSVLLLDEPTASLDPGNVGAVVELLEEWAREEGRALVWVSHRADEAGRLATRRVDLRELGP